MSYTRTGEAEGNTTLIVRYSIHRIQEGLNAESEQGTVVWALSSHLLDDEAGGKEVVRLN